MSFIAKNPLTLPEVESPSSAPKVGTRGLFAGRDGWYEIDSNNQKNKIVNNDDLSVVANNAYQGIANVGGEIQQLRQDVEDIRNNNGGTVNTDGIVTKEDASNSYKYYGDAGIVPSDQSLFNFEIIDKDSKTAKIVRNSNYGINSEVTNLLGDIVIPYQCQIDGITYKIVAIGDYVFRSALQVTSIVIPSSVTTIGISAFSGCEKAEKIVIPDSVKSLGMGVFVGNKSLKEIIIPDSISTLDVSTFTSCTNLTKVHLGSGLTQLPINCFSMCAALKEINIPKGVKKIGEMCFSGCSSLTDIWYEGDSTQWSEISINATNNSVLSNVKIHYKSVSATEGYVDEKIKDISAVSVSEIEDLKNMVALLYSKSLVKNIAVDLISSNWIQDGDNLYSQVVPIVDITEYSKIDLHPTVEQLTIFYEKDVTFIVENNDGVATVYCVGQKPVNDYTIQATVTEVNIDD